MTAKKTHDMIRLASAASPFEAHIWEQALLEDGIRCQVHFDNLRGGLRNGPGMRSEIWVEAADLERAETVLCQPAELAALGTPSTGSVSKSNDGPVGPDLPLDTSRPT